MSVRYFTAARPGIEETRGVPFAPSENRKRPRVLRPGKTRQDRQPVDRRRRVEAWKARLDA